MPTGKHRRAFNHGDPEARARKAVERVGEVNPTCLICGEPDAIRLERHHIAGRKYADETVVLCRNHHAKVTDLQKDHPQTFGNDIGLLEVSGRFCLGVSDFLILAVEDHLAPSLADLLTYVAETLKRIGLQLIVLAHGDDLDPMEVSS